MAGCIRIPGRVAETEPLCCAPISVLVPTLTWFFNAAGCERPCDLRRQQKNDESASGSLTIGVGVHTGTSAKAFAPGQLKNQAGVGISAGVAVSGSGNASGSANTPGSGNSSGSGNIAGSANTSGSASTSGSANTAGSANSSSSTGAVLGETSSAGSNGRSGGVLGATAAVSNRTLPFTGMQIWVAVLAGLMILGTGVAVRRPSKRTAAGR